MYFDALVIGDDPEQQLDPCLDWETGDNPDAVIDCYFFGAWTRLTLLPGRTGVRSPAPRIHDRPYADNEFDRARARDVDWSQMPLMDAVLQDGIWDFADGCASPEEWQAIWQDTVAALPPETLVSVYDCHI